MIKAVILFMEEFKINDQKAYEMIRTISMSKNIEIETLCESLVKNTNCHHVYNKEA
ncbi:ANTAR domain-containing protein [Psychromonas sp. KJ10-10]|uniref:ANTAR domain-containing protein n=1 Tax=Psychromonas sp. KJ10-10 TaxID=3391823 RepID=UPI0039B4AF83